MGAAAGPLFAVSAGLNVVSGVFGYLESQQNQRMANSRADMMRAAAEANAQRYSERAAAQIAQQKVMYLSSGVTLSGSPIDVLDIHARIAGENAAAIRMKGQIESFDEEQRGREAIIQGRNALLNGVTQGTGNAARAGYAGFGGTGFKPATQAGDPNMAGIEGLT